MADDEFDFFKMRPAFLFLGLFLLGLDGSLGSSDIRSSLTFVIDDTGSMADGVDQVKEGVNAIFDTVMNSSQIEDFVLVTFNDPTTKWRAKTKDRKVFKDALNEIVVDGGEDCPEMAMSGIKLGLQISREGSSLYVFTDAAAKDYNMYDEVVALSQKMGCQINFVLTGVCESIGGRLAPQYLVYKKLAEATNGQLLHLGKQEVGEVLKYVKLNKEYETETLTTKLLPAKHENTLHVTVNAAMKELWISVLGENLLVSVTDSKGTKWPTTDVSRLSKFAKMKVLGVTPDVYMVKVDSKGGAIVMVSASTLVYS